MQIVLKKIKKALKNSKLMLKTKQRFRSETRNIFT